METVEVTEYDKTSYYRELVPFGYMDINTAISTAKEAGKNAEWAAQQAMRLVDECGCKIEDVDPVCEVYEALLQEARNEIEEETGYDLCNDVVAKGAIYTAGNYCCTSYDYSEEAVEELADKLIEKEVEICTLSEETIWFLKEIGITESSIDDKKQKDEQK